MFFCSGRKSALLAAVFFVFSGTLFALNETALSAYTEGCKAYSRGDWDSSVFLLRKAVAYPEFDTADTNYMLIYAQIYADDKRSALSDSGYFLSSFPDSLYVPRILYVRGKLLYSLGEYDDAIVALSDFCNRFPDSELYPSALFYIAECLYEGCRYDEAEALYERIVSDYSESDRLPAAQYRLDSIAQRSREEKLLYLLKQTGEEYLAAKEDYERQLKLYNSESMSSARERLVDAQQKNRELEEQIDALQTQIEELKQEQAVRALQDERLRTELEAADSAPVESTAARADVQSLEFTYDSTARQKTVSSYPSRTDPETEADLKKLKEKARLIQDLLDSKKN